MNIFYLDPSPEACASYHCDKHVVSQILETAIILSTVMREKYGYDYGYQSYRAKKHPCIKWTSETLGNFIWLRNFGIALCKEYTFRYQKIHESEDIIKNACPRDIHGTETLERTPSPQCMPNEYKDEDAVVAYRNYYLAEKTHMFRYTNRSVPEWIQEFGMGEHR